MVSDPLRGRSRLGPPWVLLPAFSDVLSKYYLLQDCTYAMLRCPMVRMYMFACLNVSIRLFLAESGCPSMVMS